MNDLDPIRSREHILLSNIFEYHWSEGNDLDLTELILQTQTPPFANLGAFPVDTFFPAKDRMELAMVLNNILAAPAFETWREGETLDIQSMLFTPEGQPRHSIFYLAHLSDGERMFFVTLLLSAVETWMRTQKGSTALRALLYMDEIYGYLPPTAVPPSKGPLLRMLKQARAFGLGLLLATQNPVDMDYKALSNTGTWFIGKLQTERDKNRLLDGLESAAWRHPPRRNGQTHFVARQACLCHAQRPRENACLNANPLDDEFSGGTHDPSANSCPQSIGGCWNHASHRARTCSRFEESVHASAFRRSLPAHPNAIRLSSAVERSQPATFKPSNVQPATRNVQSSTDGNLTKPTLPAGIREYFLPQNYSLPEAFSSAKKSMPSQAMIQGIVYRPSLLAAAQVRLLDRKFGVDSEITKAALVDSLDRRGIVRWDEFAYAGPSLDKVETMPVAGARFGTIDAPLNDSKLMTALQKDFTDWIFRNAEVTARANAQTKSLRRTRCQPGRIHESLLRCRPRWTRCRT